jgi:hypothetical protein
MTTVYKLNELHSDLEKALKAMPEGVTVAYIKARHKDGSETHEEYARINEHEAVKVRTYNYS